MCHNYLSTITNISHLIIIKIIYIFKYLVQYNRKNEVEHEAWAGKVGQHFMKFLIHGQVKQ